MHYPIFLKFGRLVQMGLMHNWSRGRLAEGGFKWQWSANCHFSELCYYCHLFSFG